MVWIYEIVGILIAGLALTDVFLTVLYARAGAGVISPAICRGVWHAFRLVSKVFGNRKDAVLYLAGPILLICIAATWFVLVILGFALIYFPHTGTEILASDGFASHGFSTAVYFSMTSFTTLGTGDIYASGNFWRIISGVEAIMGFSMLTLTITYLLSVYNALVRRNTFALILHVKTASTGDAAELLARLEPGDDYRSAGSDSTMLTGNLMNLLESHHAYPVLHYFRYPQSYYALAKMMMTILDTISLAVSGLHPQKHYSFLQSTQISQLWEGSSLLLSELSRYFLPGRYMDRYSEPTDAELQAWHQHYSDTLERLQQAHISTVEDEQQGYELYVSYRRNWNAYIRAFTEYMEYDWNNIRGGHQ